jgi:LPXTG-site transpeptidase (sortase) family protein
VADRSVPQAQAVAASETSGPDPAGVEPATGTDAAPDLQEEEARVGEGANDVYPVRLRIPAIAVDARVVDLGLNQDGTLEVPADFDVTGWYTGRSVPGETGPSVVVGHVDSHTGPAVFIELSRLEAGDLVQIDRSDGLVAWFQIRDFAQVDKDEFPTQQVYGDTEEPTLRLITCGGDFDRAARSYEQNLIVFADHLGNSTPATPLSGSSPG